MFYTKEYTAKAEFRAAFANLTSTYGAVSREVIELKIHEGRLHSRRTEDLDYQWDHRDKIDWWFVKVDETPNPMLAALLDFHRHDLEQKHKKFQWTFLSKNPAAVSYLWTHLHELDWETFCENPSDLALDLLQTYPEKIILSSLCRNENPRAIALLRPHLSSLTPTDWIYLSINPNPAALALLQEHPEQIWWCSLSHNRHPEAYKLLENHLDKVNWENLGGNVAAIPILRNHLHRVSWHHLCREATTPAHFQFLRENVDRFNPICWRHLSMNPHALPFLMQFPDRITMDAIGVHPCFHVTYHYDYPAILAAKYLLHQEYHAWVGHPSSIAKWRGWEINTDLLEALGEDFSCTD